MSLSHCLLNLSEYIYKRCHKNTCAFVCLRFLPYSTGQCIVWLTSCSRWNVEKVQTSHLPFYNTWVPFQCCPLRDVLNPSTCMCLRLVLNNPHTSRSLSWYWILTSPMLPVQVKNSANYFRIVNNLKWRLKNLQWTLQTFHFIIWAGPWENVSYVICEQQRRSLICAFVVHCLNGIISLDSIWEISRL